MFFGLNLSASGALLPHSKKVLGSNLPADCMKVAGLPCAVVDFLWVISFSPTTQRQMQIGSSGYSKLATGVNWCMNDCVHVSPATIW